MSVAEVGPEVPYVAIVSDTHMPKGARRIPEPALDLMRGSELIIHAGDWSAIEVVDLLDGLGPPLIGVHGNVERPEVTRRMPETAELEWRGHRLAVIHDAGPAEGRIGRMRRRFPGSDAVIFGHSHIPLHETDPDGFQIFNPGSPTERRRSPSHTMGIGRARDGGLELELIEL